MRRLAQRVELQQPFGVGNGAPMLLSGLQPPDQPLQHRPGRAAQTIPLRLHPVFVVARQQVPRVEGGRALRRPDRRGQVPLRGRLLRSRERILQLHDVDPRRRVRCPEDRPPVRAHAAVGAGQRMAQVVEELTEIRERLCLGGVRPEEESDSTALLRGPPVQDQIGEERLQPGRVERNDPAPVGDADVAKQLDLQIGRHGGPPHGGGLKDTVSAVHPGRQAR